MGAGTGADEAPNVAVAVTVPRVIVIAPVATPSANVAAHATPHALARAPTHSVTRPNDIDDVDARRDDPTSPRPVNDARSPANGSIDDAIAVGIIIIVMGVRWRSSSSSCALGTASYASRVRDHIARCARVR